MKRIPREEPRVIQLVGCGDPEAVREVAVIRDVERKAVLDAIDEHWLATDVVWSFELRMKPPIIWRDPSLCACSTLQFFLERIESAASGGKVLGLSVKEAGGSNLYHADFDLNSGSVLEIAFFDRTGDVRLCFENGKLVMGEEWVEKIARQRSDQFLGHLCEVAGIALPPRSPL
jgi:hypothetical protein